MTPLSAVIQRIRDSFSKDDYLPAKHFAKYHQELERLRDQHEHFTVLLNGASQKLQSLILSIDYHRRELVIDEPFPSEDIGAVNSGDSLEIHSQSQQLSLSFHTHLLSREPLEGKSSWRLELPEAIGPKQNRKSYRVYVENEEQLKLSLAANNAPLASAKILNLSASGLKWRLSESEGKSLTAGQQFSDVVITLSESCSLQAEITLITHYSIRNPQSHWLCGGQLTIADPKQQLTLQQYLASVQRQQRRRETRLFEH